MAGEAYTNKCHVCLGSYNETAQHAKRQHNGAEESSRQQCRGAKQGGVQGRATEQGSRAGEQGKAAGQGRGAGQQGSRARQGSRAGQQAKFNLQTAAEGRTFVKEYVNFLTRFCTGRRFSAILLNRVFVLYVFYHVLRSAPYPADRDTIKGFRAQPPGKPVRMRIKMAAEVQTFVKEYVDFLMSL